jgi:putative peptidoglycan lipid II flippase
MIKKIFNKEINSIAVAAVLIAASSLVSRLLGFLRDRILAGEFGAGQTLDIYYAAFRLPDFIYNIVILGALTAGLIPVFTGLINDWKDGRPTLFSNNNKEGWALINNLLNTAFLFLVVVCVLGFVFADQLTKILSPGFSAQAQEQCAHLTRIMLLSPILLSISGIFGGILQSFRRFFLYSLSPILYNVGIIAGALFLVPKFGISGLAWGVVMGAFMHMSVQLPGAFLLGYRYSFIVDFGNKSLRKIARMMIPRTLTLAITQFNFMATTIIATGLAAGSLAAFNLANNLQSFPIGIFGVSFDEAAFPILSAAAGKNDKMVKHFSNAFRQILFFIVPSTVLFLVLRAQVTRLAFGSGSFDWEDTILTFQTLSCFTVSLFAQATIPLLIRVFYARHDSKTPFFIGLVSVAANIGLSLYLAPIKGVVGLALAFSISSILNFILLWLFLHNILGDMDEGKILSSVFKFSLAAVACGYVTQMVKSGIGGNVPIDSFLNVLLQSSVSVLAGLVIYLLICYFLRSEEAISFFNSVKSRLIKISSRRRVVNMEEV